MKFSNELTIQLLTARIATLRSNEVVNHALIVKAERELRALQK